jgi:tetratricopeptide (TPR) repeat protein
VLSEEALIFLGGLAALGAVALGVLELLWPTRPRHPLRPSVEAPAPLPPPPPAVTATSVTPPPRRWRSRRRRHALNGSGIPYRRRPPSEPVTAALRAAFEEEPLASSPPVAVRPHRVSLEPAVAMSAEAKVDTADAAEQCFALYQAGAYAEAVAAASTAMIGKAAGGRAAEVARLWSIVALARRAMDDHAGARTALEAALTTAPDSERPAYSRQLASLATEVARGLVADVESGRGPTSEQDVDRLRQAVDWAERAAATVPNDEGLRALATDLQRRLWPTCEGVVLGLVQRQQFRSARALLREALDDPRFPAARAATFRELFSGTYGGEIGQLTAQAIRSMQAARETEALAALERAEELLESLHDEALPPNRREEVDRRLWWGYKKLGRRRAQAGEYEGAVDALAHALRFAGVGTDRQADTRATLVRALEGLAEQRALIIRELADAGDREAALVQTDKLWSRLRGAFATGLAETDLAVAFAKAQRVFDEVNARS